MLSRPARLLAALVLISGVGCSFIPAYTSPAAFRAASLFPANTWLFTDINFRPSLSQVAGATRLANAFTSQPGWETYTSGITRSFTAGGTNLFSDVLTQLDGEVAVGAVGSLTGSTETPDVLILAHSSNPDHLLATLSSVEGLSAPTPTRDSRGANLYTLPDARGVATYQGWLVVASSKSDLNEALNRISGGGATGASLSNQPTFKALVDRLPTDRLALEYIDSGALYRALASDIPPDTRALLGNSQSQMAVSFAAAPSGLEVRVEGATHLAPDVAAQADLGSVAVGDPADAFAHMPPNTLAAFGAALPPPGPEIDDELNAALQQAADNLDVPELADIELHPSQWLTGPIGIGGSTGQPGGDPDLFLVAQVSDTDTARADLATVARLFPPKSVASVDIAGAPFYVAPVSNGGSLTYGLAEDWLYAVSGDAETVVDAAGSGGLSENQRFAAMRSALGQDSPNVFIDIQGVRNVATGMLSATERRTFEAEVGPLLNPLTFFGGGLRSDANGDVHGHFILGIAGG